MYLLTVSLLADGIPYEELSYFSKQEVTPGDLVEVTVRKRVCRALVVKVVSLKEEKQSLKHASFVTKKISQVLYKEFIHPKLWQALTYASSCALKNTGTLVHDLLSEKSFQTITSLSVPLLERGFEILLLEQAYEYRMQRYKTTIREMFSKKYSLVMFFPTILDLEQAKESLSRGIDEYVIMLHSGLSDKDYEASLLKIQDTSHPVLILSTPSLVPWVRNDLGLLIFEREHSHYYYTHGDEGYDMRRVLEHIAKVSGIPCLLGSHMLSLRAHMLHKKKDAIEIMPLQYRNDANVLVVPVLQENRTASPYLSKHALQILRYVSKTKEGHYFFYAHRKGMYPTTVCADCGELFTCTECHRPYVLHKIGGIRTYVCHSCESIVQLNEDSTLACRYCGGWRMTTLGIATTGVEEELQRLGIPLFVIDSERTPTKAKVKKVYKEWQESPYGILIGTEMAHNVVRSCDGIVVLSLDSLFAIPEYRTDEKVLSLITEMSEKIVREQEGDAPLILQTRIKNLPIIQYLATPSFREVYTALLKEREHFLLPPYYTVIKASFENLQEDLRKRYEEELAPYTVVWFEQGKGITLLFIHIKESEWLTQEEIRERVKRVVYDAKPLVNPLHFFIS